MALINNSVGDLNIFKEFTENQLIENNIGINKSKRKGFFSRVSKKTKKNNKPKRTGIFNRFSLKKTKKKNNSKTKNNKPVRNINNRSKRTGFFSSRFFKKTKKNNNPVRKNNKTKKIYNKYKAKKSNLLKFYGNNKKTEKKTITLNENEPYIKMQFAHYDVNLKDKKKGSYIVVQKANKPKKFKFPLKKSVRPEVLKVGDIITKVITSKKVFEIPETPTSENMDEFIRFINESGRPITFHVIRGLFGKTDDDFTKFMGKLEDIYRAGPVGYHPGVEF